MKYPGRPPILLCASREVAAWLGLSALGLLALPLLARALLPWSVPGLRETGAENGHPLGRLGQGSGYVPRRTRQPEEITMAVCETCGNDYDMAFEVHAQGAVHTFDSFQCAIQAMAPICEHCGTRVIGHGVQAGEHWYCCAHCARQEGSEGIVDRVMAGMSR